MSSGLTIFEFESHPVRTYTDAQGEPWWAAADACRAMALVNTSQVISRLDDEERGVLSNEGVILPAHTPGNGQELAVINESGLYSLILTSRKPEAKRFKKWLTSEVLPAIRKTGRYEIAKPQLLDADIEGDYLLRQIDHTRELIVRQRQAERRLTVAETNALAARLEAEAAYHHAELARAEASAANANASAAIATLTDDTKYMSMVGYTAKHKLKFTRLELAAQGRKLSALCESQGIEIKELPSEAWGKVNAYPVEALEKWFSSKGN